MCRSMLVCLITSNICCITMITTEVGYDDIATYRYLLFTYILSYCSHLISHLLLPYPFYNTPLLNPLNPLPSLPSFPRPSYVFLLGISTEDMLKGLLLLHPHLHPPPPPPSFPSFPPLIYVTLRYLH